MMLSKNLSLNEVVKSHTAKRLGIDNMPSEEHLANLKEVGQNVFQPLRDHFGVPIGITSGYRSPVLNKRIGGANRSQHTKGEALDIDADIYGKINNTDIFNFILNELEFDTLIAEFEDDGHPAWVHVSYRRESNRGKVLVATRIDGRTRYIKYSQEVWDSLYGKADVIDVEPQNKQDDEKLRKEEERRQGQDL